MLKKIVKISEIVLMVIFTILIVILMTFIIKRWTSKDNNTTMFGYYVYEVSSPSMYKEGDPNSLEVGALIFVKEKDEYEVGDVVTYQLKEGETPITHQIIAIDGDTITTKGINPVNSEDAPFDKDKIIGAVVGKFQNYGKITDFVMSPYGIITIIAVGVILVEGSNIINKKLKKREENKEKEEEVDEQN